MVDVIKTYSIDEIYKFKLQYTEKPKNFNFILSEEELLHYNKTYNKSNEDNNTESWRVNQNQFKLTRVKNPWSILSKENDSEMQKIDKEIKSKLNKLTEKTFDKFKKEIKDFFEQHEFTLDIFIKRKSIISIFKIIL